MSSATFDITKPFKTRDGLNVRILCTDRRCMGEGTHLRPLVGLITEYNGDEIVGAWFPDGTWRSSGTTDRFDLVNTPPPKRVMYVNVYANSDEPDGFSYCSSSTRRDADKKASPNREACVRVEYVDGQMDD